MERKVTHAADTFSVEREKRGRSLEIGMRKGMETK